MGEILELVYLLSGICILYLQSLPNVDWPNTCDSSLLLSANGSCKFLPFKLNDRSWPLLLWFNSSSWRYFDYALDPWFDLRIGVSIAKPTIKSSKLQRKASSQVNRNFTILCPSKFVETQKISVADRQDVCIMRVQSTNLVRLAIYICHRCRSWVSKYYWPKIQCSRQTAN